MVSHPIPVLIRHENALFYEKDPVPFSINDIGTYLYLGSLTFRTKKLQLAHGLGRHELVISTPNRSYSIRPTQANIQDWPKVKRALKLLVSSPSRYFYKAILGKGRFGTVYHATIRSTSQQVAVKEVCKKNLKQVGFSLSLARREQQIFKNLQSHNHIVKVVETYETNLALYTVMEYVKGCTLAALTKTRSLSENEILRIIKQLLQAVSHLHQNNIIHRDLKLENILVTRSSDEQNLDIKVCDFGLALDISNIEQNEHTQKVGTGYTQAPELVIPQHLQNHSSTSTSTNGTSLDVWACGIILFILTYRRLPFSENVETQSNQMKQMIQMTNNDDSYLRTIQTLDERIRTPQKLHRLLNGLLHPNPSSRLTADDALQIISPSSVTLESNCTTRLQSRRKRSIRDVARIIVSLLRITQSLRDTANIALPRQTMIFV